MNPYENVRDAIIANRFAREYAHRIGLTDPSTLLEAIDRANDALFNPAVPNETVVALHAQAALLVTLPAPKAPYFSEATSLLLDLKNVGVALEGVTRDEPTLTAAYNSLKALNRWWGVREAVIGQTEQPVAQPAPVVTPDGHTLLDREAVKATLDAKVAAGQPTTGPVAAPNAAHKKGALPPVGSKLTHADKSGKTAEATVTSDGNGVNVRIEFNGQKFTSLSASALAAAHWLGSNIKAVNGNVFWTVTPPTGA